MAKLAAGPDRRELSPGGSPRPGVGVGGAGGQGEAREGGTWRALSSMSAGLARAASRAVVVVPMLEPRKRGYARSKLISPTPGGAGREHRGLSPRPRGRGPAPVPHAHP